MPVVTNYPGVYVEEIRSGVHTITGVATSIAAFVGSADRGPTDDPTIINSFGDFERIFGGLSNDSQLGFSVRDFFLNGGSQAVIVRVTGGASASGPATAEIALPAAAGPTPPPTPAPAQLVLVASSPGLWGNDLKVTVDYNTKVKGKGFFNLTVLQKNDPGPDIQKEKFLNLSGDPKDPRYVSRVLRQSSFIGVKDDPDNTVFGTPKEATTPVSTPAVAGGSLGDPEVKGDPLAKTGIFALEKTDLFNMLIIPPYDANGGVSLAVISAAAEYCKARRALLLVDPPVAWTDAASVLKAVNDATTDRVGTRSSYAAMFFPRIYEANPLHEGQIEEFAPSGAVAGVFARTDAQRGVWKAPAGVDATLVGVPQLAVSLTDAENGMLNPVGVNCLRSFPIIGRVVWGARTLAGADIQADDYKYIPVRRLALYIEESLYRGTKWVVFEPNDEPLWAQIRLNIGAFMHNLFRQGAFQGTTPNDAYFVKCDKESTIQNDIDLGIVNIVVGFAPLKPAEFVIIQIQQIAGQIQV
jgi:phage tail sheath protein FI